MLVIGLTGGIGSGKTTVAQLFAKQGVPIIDADLIAHELTQTEKPAWKAIIAHFGPLIVKPDKVLDRQKLRELIFNDVKKRLWLEQLLHPLIIEAIKKKIQELKDSYCIIVIPLLIETGPYSFIDRILVVDTLSETQIERLEKRDQSKRRDLQKIMASQTSREKRLAAAQDVIHNNGRLDELQDQVTQLHQSYCNRSRP